MCYNRFTERVGKLMSVGKNKSKTVAPKVAGGATKQTITLAYRFMYDLVVKMVFSQNPDLLQNLVARLLKIDPNSIKDFHITNSKIVPDTLGEKFCRLDILMYVDGRRCNLEVTNSGRKGRPLARHRCRKGCADCTA